MKKHILFFIYIYILLSYILVDISVEEFLFSGILPIKVYKNLTTPPALRAGGRQYLNVNFIE